MSDTPDISVVMSVYNGARHLRQSIDSVLRQQDVKFEFIVVNDGSTDESPQILEEYSRFDTRLRVFHQENQGLTRALITGCEQARGSYIARQDTGDISLPHRLSKQLACAIRNSNAVLVSCGTRFVGPANEHLYDIVDDQARANERLLTLELKEIRGPSHHGSALFPREMYEKVGGYRAAFRFAQDLDLWIRLAEQGHHLIMPDILYQALVDVASISGLYRKEQVATARAILECARQRRDGLSEASTLEKASAIGLRSKWRFDRIGRARALYFIGVCLRKRKDPLAQDYFKRAFVAFPLHLKSAARLLIG